MALLCAVGIFIDLLRELLWRGGLPPFGGEAVVKPLNAVCLKLLR